MSRFAISLILIVGCAWLLISCAEDSSKEVRSDNTEIARLLTDDADALAMLPRIWFDTSYHSLEESAGKPGTTLDYVNPSDFRVEILSFRRGFVINDSCAPDTLISSDPCGDVLLETGARAPAKIVQLRDTIDCRYHLLVQDGDSSYTVSKDSVRFLGMSWVLVAQLGISEAHYNGWDVYGIGRQRQAENYLGSLPHLDSVRVNCNSGTYMYYPRQGIDYEPLVMLPEIERGESFSISLYTQKRTSSGEFFYDAYVHKREDRIFQHQRVGIDIGANYSFRITETSGSSTSTYSQIGIELLPFKTLRDDSPAAFGSYLFAFTYRVK